MFENDTYQEHIKSFKKVLSAEADTLLSNESLAVIYIGRETCPFCRKFAKKLNSIADQINTPIYYIDSENYSDDKISSFRQKYNVITVPGFIVSKNGEIEVRCDSSTPENEILSMIK